MSFMSEMIPPFPGCTKHPLQLVLEQWLEQTDALLLHLLLFLSAQIHLTFVKY